MSKIIRLEAENVKRLKAVCIEPNGKPVVIIGGRNGQGKSSLLDSIEYALGGKPDVERPIRDGESRARVIVETEELVVTRHFTPKDSRVEVQAKSGELRHTIKSPQALLDKLVGKLAFDPLAFSRMDSKSQVATLRELTGVDFRELDAERLRAYDERTALNREAKALNAQLQSLPDQEGLPEDEVSVSELAQELERRMELNRGNDEKRGKLAAARKDEERIGLSVASIEREIAELQRMLDSEKQCLADAVHKREGWEKLVASLEDAGLEEIREQLRGAEEVNVLIRQNQKQRSLQMQAQGKETEIARYTAKIEEIDRRKRELLAASPLPIAGLSFDEAGVSFNGIPFSQCSSAEQLRVSVAMGLAMNPELKLLLIRDGSLLDSDSLRMVEEMARAADATIMIERVGDGQEVSVVIEDGSVKEIR